MRIGLAQGTQSPPVAVPVDEFGDETVAMSMSDAQRVLVDASDRSLFETKEGAQL